MCQLVLLKNLDDDHGLVSASGSTFQFNDADNTSVV